MSMLIWPRVLFQKDVGVLEAFQEDLEAARLLRKRLPFSVERASLPEVVVERLGGEVDNVCVWYDVRSKLGVEDVCGGFGDVAQIRNEACAPKEERKQVAMYPFRPLGVALRVRLFVLGLENTHNLALRVACKVAA